VKERADYTRHDFTVVFGPPATETPMSVADCDAELRGEVKVLKVYRRPNTYIGDTRGKIAI
jgi:hypothetical protein